MSDVQSPSISSKDGNIDPLLPTEELNPTNSKRPVVNFGPDEENHVPNHEAPPPSEVIPNITIPEQSKEPTDTVRSRKRGGVRKGVSVAASIINRHMALVTDDVEDGEKEINEEKLRLFIRNVVKEKRSAEDTRKWLYAALVSLLLLCTANIGTAYLAVYLAKDTDVKDSHFVSKATGDIVSMNGLGEMLNIDVTSGSRRFLSTVGGGDYVCVKEADFAKIWYKAGDGSSVGINLNYPVEENRQEGIELRWHGSTLSPDKACFNTVEDGKQVCALFDDDRCITEEDERRLRGLSGERNSLEPIRREIFNKHLDALKNGKTLDESTLFDMEDSDTYPSYFSRRLMPGQPNPFTTDFLPLLF